jgi:DNA polymerase (family 10)
VTRAEIAGSARRACETVRDLDLLVAGNDPEALQDEFGRLPQVSEVIARDGMTITVRVRSGMQVDLRATRPDGFGASWVTFTGSPAHNLQLRARADKMGKVIAGATEEDVYAALGCAWIPPELREGRGEIELASQGLLPALIQDRDLRGDLHTHSNWSDGRNEIAVMARSAAERGYQYIVLTDHTQSLTIAQGLTPERFRARAVEIAAVNAQPGMARVFSGAEVDILPDGNLDLPDDCLASLDLVVASVHTALDQPKDVITQRVLRALRSPHVDVLAHPTSRRLDRRGETRVDIEAVIAEAVKTGTALEINSSPFRLDLNDSWARKAREAGALLAIDNDAHYPAEYDYLRYGCAIGRRAGLTPDRVLNTRDAVGVLAHCREKEAKGVANLR